MVSKTFTLVFRVCGQKGVKVVVPKRTHTLANDIWDVVAIILETIVLVFEEER